MKAIDVNLGDVKAKRVKRDVNKYARSTVTENGGQWQPQSLSDTAVCLGGGDLAKVPKPGHPQNLKLHGFRPPFFGSGPNSLSKKIKKKIFDLPPDRGSPPQSSKICQKLILLM